MRTMLKLSGFATGIVICLMTTSCRTPNQPSRILTLDGFTIEKGARQGAVAPTGEPEDQLITRDHDVLPNIWGIPDRMAGTKEEPVDVWWKRLFTELGVSWPEGSSITFKPTLYILSVTNTRRNVDLIETLLMKMGVVPAVVEIDFQIVAFQTKDIEQLQLAGGMIKEALFDLRRAGKAKLVGTSSTVTQSGSEATMKTVQEVIYPTQLTMDAGLCDTNQTSQGVALFSDGAAMREVGMILQVIPEITPNGKMINLTLAPAWVTLDRWEAYPATLAAEGKHTPLQFRQPIFGVTSTSTRVQVESGDTILLGSSLTPDGKQVNVGFLTARLRKVLSQE